MEHINLEAPRVGLSSLPYELLYLVMEYLVARNDDESEQPRWAPILDLRLINSMVFIWKTWLQ